ncbi:MAG: NADP-dependent isocitrate dehydrogenase [Phycisphaerales bacterium]|nr:NADP-dependent isocitrate dehydrogenase [Phycisphaerales bacterium]
MTVARGDGIGPEIMDSVLFLLREAGARLDLETIEIGAQMHARGHSAGIEPGAWESLRRTGVFLKAPITTPQGTGVKSLNVTIRKTLGLYANVRPCRTWHPFVPTSHPDMNVVVIRENEEDTYGGIEHRQTPEVTQCLKLISRPGTEKLVRYAFEYARRHGRRRVSCFTKDNIMKLTDGLFHRVFREVAAAYPELESEHRIIDIGTARLAKDPLAFDVLVLPNLFGDIVSDVAAELAGSVGLAGSANIGETCAMFEAVHGSAPDIAGRDLANPSGLLHAAVMMLEHLEQGDVAERLHNAWLCTIEDGIHTVDVAPPTERHRAVGTRAFTQAVAERMGRVPGVLPAAEHLSDRSPRSIVAATRRPRPQKSLVGVDVFFDWDESERRAEVLASRLEPVAGAAWRLSMITNRGVKVYPGGLPETFCTDHWRCRFLAADGRSSVTHAEVVGLLGRLAEAGLDFVKTEHLCTFDGERGYSLGQGE